MTAEISDNKKILSVVLSSKVRKGSIKVSDADIPNLQVGIVDDVVVTPIGKNEGVSEMLFADSKVQSGFVLINTSDAGIIDVESGDKVTIEKLTDIQQITNDEKENLPQKKSLNIEEAKI